MRRGTVRYTEDTQMAMTNIHFALAMPHVKCNHKHHPTRPFSTSLSKQTLFYGWHWCVCVWHPFYLISMAIFQVNLGRPVPPWFLFWKRTSFLPHFNGHFPGELGSASSPLVSLLEENLLSTSFQRPFSRWTWVSQFLLGFSSGREPPFYLISTAIFQVNLGQPVPLGFSSGTASSPWFLFWKRTSGDKWYRFYLLDALPVINTTDPSNRGNSKHWPNQLSFTYTRLQGNRQLSDVWCVTANNIRNNSSN